MELEAGSPLNLVLPCVAERLILDAKGNRVVSIQSTRGEVRLLPVESCFSGASQALNNCNLSSFRPAHVQRG